MKKYTYDAFISYSHNEKDAFAAEQLHKTLEHYHIPKRIQQSSGKKKIERVFRDQEEMPISFNLASNIQEALDQSEFLILMCSPNSIKSEWVQREVETFLKSHSKEQVLTVLLEGEPEKVFPEVLCYEERKVESEDGTEQTVKVRIEPMAADIRGKDKSEIKKKIEQESLRILAKMLGCTYDTLRQRHREYALHRMMAVLGGVAGVAVVFTIYAFHQSAKINERYQESRRNQARYLSQISTDLLDGGDRENALLTALAVVPEDSDSDEPVAEEQMYALNEALHSYEHDEHLNYKPLYKYEMSGNTYSSQSQSSGMLSEDGQTYFCVDQLGNAYVLNVEDGSCIWKIAPGEWETKETNGFRKILPVKDEKAVLITKKGIFYIDWKKQQLIREMKNDAEEDFLSERDQDGACCTVSGTNLAIANGHYLWVYDLESGECQLQSQYDQEKYSSDQANAIAFDEKAENVFLALGNEWEYAEPSASEGKESVLKIQISTGEKSRVATEKAKKICAVSENQMAVLHMECINEDEVIDNVGMSAVQAKYWITLYDTEEGKKQWSSVPYTVSGYTIPETLLLRDMEINGELKKVLVVSVKDRIQLIDAENGTVIREGIFREDIVNVVQADKRRLLVGLSDGSVMIGTVEDMSANMEVGSVSGKILDFTFSPEHQQVIWTMKSGKRLVFGEKQTDQQMKSVNLEKENDVDSVKYTTWTDQKGKEQNYRIIEYNGLQTDLKEGVRVYRTGTSDLIFQYECKTAGGMISEVKFSDIDGNPGLSFKVIEKYESNELGKRCESKYVTADLNSGKICSEQTEDEVENQFDSVSAVEVGNKGLAVMYGNEDFTAANKEISFMTGSLTEKGIQFSKKAKSHQVTEEGRGVNWVSITADDRYVLFYIDNKDDTYCLKVWNVEKEKWESYDGQTELLVLDARDKRNSMSIGAEKNLLATYTQDGMIHVFDLEKGTEAQTLKCGNYKKIQMGFCANDQYLVTYDDSEMITLWDISEGKILMKEEYDSKTSIESLYTNGSGWYFGVGFYGYTLGDEGFYTSELMLYSIDKEGKFYKYAYIPAGYADYTGKEICVASGEGWYSPFYSFSELRKRAEKEMAGKSLSDADKNRYFISE